jgi:hypothetical protein
MTRLRRPSSHVLWTLGLGGGLALAACRADRSAPPPPPPLAAPEVAASASTSPFHLALRGPGDTSLGELEPRGSLCPIEGRAFVCGLGQVLFVDGEEIRHDAALEVGLSRISRGDLAGVVSTIVGRWPDDAWLVQATACCNPHIPRRVYRYIGGGWTERATFDAVDFEVLPSPHGLLVEWSAFDEKGVLIHRRELVAPDGRAPPRRLESRRVRIPLDALGSDGFDAGAGAPGGEVLSHARDSTGTEWAVVAGHGYPTAKNTLLRRRPAGAWEAVDAPPLSGGGEPKRVWAVAGEAWLLVWYEARADYFAGLFRTGDARAARRITPSLTLDDEAGAD